jgi:peptidoglycan/LPS O-acetylase OafA/YrhL
MRFAAWYAIVVGLLMLGQWALFITTGRVPELATARWEIGFHLAGEITTALALLVGGAGVLVKRPRLRQVLPVALGMLLYTVIVSPGYFAQRGEWTLVAVFAGLLLLALVSLGLLLRDAYLVSERP